MIETGSSNGAHGQDATGSPAKAGENSLESVHTSSLSEILSNQSISLCISTYQAGKVIIARVDDGVTNTHFRAFKKPMGVTASADRLILGTQGQIFDLRNVPSAAQKIEPEGKHTAAYMPRAVYNTGDIDIHEMAIIEDEVIFVNTRFSCLCRLNSKYSFEPIWKPDFISAYDPRDRCHLNGLAVRDHKVRYVSALGTSDEPGGWRNNKTSGARNGGLHCCTGYGLNCDGCRLICIHQSDVQLCFSAEAGQQRLQVMQHCRVHVASCTYGDRPIKAGHVCHGAATFHAERKIEEILGDFRIRTRCRRNIAGREHLHWGQGLRQSDRTAWRGFLWDR